MCNKWCAWTRCGIADRRLCRWADWAKSWCCKVIILHHVSFKILRVLRFTWIFCNPRTLLFYILKLFNIGFFDENCTKKRKKDKKYYQATHYPSHPATVRNGSGIHCASFRRTHHALVKWSVKNGSQKMRNTAERYQYFPFFFPKMPKRDIFYI